MHSMLSEWRRVRPAFLTALVCIIIAAGCTTNGESAHEAGSNFEPGITPDPSSDPNPDPNPGFGSAAEFNVQFERSTPEQIGLTIPLSSSPPLATTAKLHYRVKGRSTWQLAHPLLRIHPEWNALGAPVEPVDAFAGTVFDLTPGTTYEVAVTITLPGEPSQTVYKEATTRALPLAGGAATVQGSPTDNLQVLFDRLRPGDVLELQAGTYTVSGLQLKVAGESAAPIVIRGVDRDAAVIHFATGMGIQLLQTSHVIFENLTLQGSGMDSGTDASSTAVSFWDGASQEFITFRHLNILGVDKGIVATGPVKSILVYENHFVGNNQWTKEFIAGNLTWNDDGIRLPGEGNCAFNNTLHGFGDAFAVNDGAFSAAVYYYRNKITMTGDDAFEGDYGTRNMAFYDNHITNAATLLSLDPLWGGPLYCFRNIIVNTFRGPLKLNSTQSGYLVYNNTIIRTDGTTEWGWVQFNNGAQKNVSFRNNILVYHGRGPLMALESAGMDPLDFTHNGWYPDRAVWWSGNGGSYASLAEAYAGLNATTPVFGTSTRRHEGDVILVKEPFESVIPLGGDHLTEISTFFVPVLASESNARNIATEIPNITDRHSGAKPDMGAVISGQTTPAWGASP